MQPSSQPKTLGKPPNGLLKTFLYIATSSVMPCLKNFSFFKLTELGFLPSWSSSVTIALPGIQQNMPLGSFPQAEKWRDGWTTLWVSFLSEITALCCLLYNAPKQSAHIFYPGFFFKLFLFYPVLWLFMAEGLVWYQLLHQSEKSPKEFMFDKI